MPCTFDIKVLLPDEFANLYLPQWSNALCEKRKHLDMLAIAAFDGEKLIGLAVETINNVVKARKL